MHFHVPKPIHGWKQFFNEVAVITVGIAIALSAEELITHWNEERQADKSLAAIKLESSANLSNMKARLSTADCIDKRLGEIAIYIEAPQGAVRPQWIGRPQLWGMQSSAVQAARSYGSLTVLPVDEQMQISSLYTATDQFAGAEMDEQWAWAQLRSLTEDRELSDSDKAAMRAALQRARFASWLLKTVAAQAIDQGKDMGIEPTSRVEGSRSVCIAMNTPRDEAEKQASVSGYGEPL